MNTSRSVQVLAATALLCAVAGPAMAGDCDRTKTVTVPYTWTLTQTGDESAGFAYDNDGGSFARAVSKALFGSFNIGSNFTPPGVFCSQLDPTPTVVSLKLTGHLVGSYMNPTLGFNLEGFPVETYVKFDADLSLVPAFPQQSFGFGFGNVDFLRTAVKSVGAGDVAYSGSLNVATKYGFGVPVLSTIQGFALLTVKGDLSDPVVNIGFSVPDPIPEPASYAMLIAGLGVLACLRRRALSSAA